MNHNYNCDERQRFSLRKLTVGLASVLVGLTLFGYSQTTSQTVHAATTDQSDPNVDYDESGSAISIPGGPTLDPDGDPIDQTYDVNYGANDQTQTIHYKDDKGDPAKDGNGQPIPDGHVTGKTDDTDKDVPMPNGWKPKDPNTDGKTDLNNPDPNTGNVPDKDVTIEHGQHTTAPGETHKKGDPIIKDAPGSTDTATQTGPENKYQEDINDADVKKDLTRTVTINKPKVDGNTTIGEGGKQQIDLDPETKSSTVNYHRTTTVDDVTGKVTGHGNWELVDQSKNQFDGVTVPQFDGYTAHITDGEGHTLSSINPENAPTANDAIEGYQSPKIVVNYTANNQSVTYVFTDGAKGNVGNGTVHGVTGQTVDSKAALDAVIKQLTDKGYDMSKVTIDPYKFHAQNGDITIDLANDHGIIKGVDPNPGGQDNNTPGDATKIPEGLKDTDGHLVTLEDTRKEITRTITAKEPTGENETSRANSDLSQHGVVTRTFDYDPVTKTITHWNAWRPVSWDAVTFYNYPGYSSYIFDGDSHTLDSIDSVTTSDPSYKDPEISIVYTADSQGRNYVFTDSGKTIDQQTVYGYTHQTVDPATQLGDIKSDLESKGYDLSKIDLGGNYKFKPSDNDQKVIDLSQAHGFKEIGSNDPIPDGVTDPNKDGSDKHVTNSDVTETVTRHITFHDPTHENSTSTQDRNVAQTVTLKRGFTYDTVTNEVTKYGDWTTQAVPAVDVPQVAGYNATVTGVTLQDGKIPADTLRDGYTDPKIEVTYTAEDSTQTIHYVDKEGHDLTSDDNKDNHGHVIGDSTVTVKTDEVGNVQVPKGWKLVDSSDAHTKVSYGDDGHIPVKTVKIEHDTITVDPSENVKPGSPIDPQNPDGPKYPKEASYDNLYKIAQRRVVFKLPSSTKASDYAKRLKETHLDIDDTDIDEKANTVTVIEKIAEKRSVIIDAVTGEVKGYVDDNDKDANKAQGWIIDPTNTAELRNVEQNGQFANFKAVLIPQISGYKANVEVGKTTVTLTRHSRMLFTPMMVSFMAFAPNPGFDGINFDGISGDSDGKVVNNDAKPDDKGDVGIKDVKDLSQKDKDQIMPGQKGDDHKGQDQGEGQPAKGDDHKGQDQGKGQPAKGDDHKGQDQGAKKDDLKGDNHKSQDQGAKKDDLKGDNTQGQTTQNGGQDAKGDQTPQDANGNQGAAGSTETAKGKGSVDKTNEKPSKNTDKKPVKKTNKKSSKPSHKTANGNSKVSGHKPNKKSAKKAVKNNTTETTKASVQNAVQPNKAAAPVANAKAEQNGNGTVQAATVNSGAKEGTLPQTGETQNNKLGIIGLALASIAGLFGLAGDKKRKRN